MWKKISPLIKATCTIIFCTTALTLALAKTHVIDKSELNPIIDAPLVKIAPQSPQGFSFQIAGSSRNDVNTTNNINSWMHNLPISWHSYLVSVPQNHYDKP